MKTSFDTWLAELAAAGLGGSALGDDAIPRASRGKAWAFVGKLAGDWSTATFAGTISASPDAPGVLATMMPIAPVYDAGTAYTTFGFNMTSTQVDSLPNDSDGDGAQAFPFTMTITPSGGTEKVLVGGAFVVLGKA